MTLCYYWGMSDAWNDPQFAKEYMDNSSSKTTNWYEHAVNASSLQSLIPHTAKKILDFGCGSGEFTILLKDAGYDVDGSDGSAAMIQLARMNHPSIDFFVWDGSVPVQGRGVYDAITTKLAFHFVKDLNVVACNILPLLNHGGSLIMSVPHPVSTMPKANGEYFKQSNYDTDIGSYGMSVTMIHRSLQDYMMSFLSNGYVLTAIAEPSVSDQIAERHGASREWAAIPRRLNLRFQKV